MAALPVHVSANAWVGINFKAKKVTPSPMEISKSGLHEVEWYCTEKDSSATVKFVDSPFLAAEFRVSKGGTACSGSVVSGVVGREYKYTVEDSTGAAPPATGIIIIRP